MAIEEKVEPIIPPAPTIPPYSPVAVYHLVPQTPPSSSDVPDHVISSLLNLVFCCLPLGIAAVILSSQANSMKYHNAEEAHRKAQTAAVLNVISFVLGATVSMYAFYYFYLYYDQSLFYLNKAETLSADSVVLGSNHTIV